MPPSVPGWTFGPFTVDLPNACLRRDGEPIALPPKAFDVLRYLVSHPDRLVTKDELLDAVWPETAVSDAVVRVAIGALRKALDDTQPPCRCIATVLRRGYRFLAPVTLTATPGATVAPPSLLALPPFPRPLLVGREATLQRLWEAWAHVRQGRRQVIGVTGEAGIGKTTVVEAFRAEVAKDAAVWLAVGQCVEHYGTGEAYLPILEALGQLCRGPGGAALVALLRQQAPTWLVQLPWLLSDAHREQLSHELQGATRERMLREFAELVEALTVGTPLLLILEDLHWSDYATVDLLALLARRRVPAHLLVVGTYRPVEAIVRHHPLRTVMQDLQRHGHVTELPLALLSAADVAAYLAARFPQPQFPAALAPWLHQRSDGNPLFLVTMVQEFIERGMLQNQDGRWTLQARLDTLAPQVPESLQRMLAQQITHLPPEAQRVLEVASVAGVEFVAAAVAAGLEADAAVVEEQCEALVEQQLLHSLEVTIWPNGTVATRYAFRHALYQQVVYARLGVGRRMRLHQRLGECLEAAYGAQTGGIAAELAEHFVGGRDSQRAVHYLHQAAEKAAHRYAHREVIDLLTRALALLRELPATPTRIHQEIDLQVVLGAALSANKGPAAPEVEQTYARARALCQEVGKTSQLFPALRGLCLFYRARGALQTARELGEQLYQLAQHTTVPQLRLEAHEALGATLFFLGEYATARTHLEQGITLTDPAAQRTQALRYGVAPGVRCFALTAHILWSLGYPAQAMQWGKTALALVQELAHPHSLALAWHFATFLHYCRRDVSAVQAQAEALLALAIAQGFPLFVGEGTFWRGWALAMQGQGPEEMAQMRQGMVAALATGQMIERPFYLVLLAEAAAHTGQVEAGLRLLGEALTAFAASGRGDLLAEAHRLQGTLLLQQTRANAAQAEACFQQALIVARRQHAKSWELRAAMSLARLWQHHGRRAAAHQLLAEVYGWFTEGFDTADLREANALLDELA